MGTASSGLPADRRCVDPRRRLPESEDLVMEDCTAELCPMWGGDECLCAAFGIDRDNPPRNGTFTRVVSDE